MSVITARILPSNFEVLRDRIFSILADEMSFQAVTFNDSDLNLKIWNSRSVAFDKGEAMPQAAVNLNYVHSDYTSMDVTMETDVHKYTIDVHTGAKTKQDGSRGDANAMVKAQKILGICKKIFMDPKYKTLGFNPPFVQRRWCESVDIAASSRGDDADSLTMGRLVVNVQINEECNLIEAALVKGFDTQVKLELTDKGYYFQVNNYA